MGAARIRMVLADDGPRLPGYDQDRWSRDLEYQDADAARFYQSLDLERRDRLGTPIDLPLLLPERLY